MHFDELENQTVPDGLTIHEVETEVCCISLFYYFIRALQGETSLTKK